MQKQVSASRMKSFFILLPSALFLRAKLKREVLAHGHERPYTPHRTRSVPGSGALPDARTIFERKKANRGMRNKLEVSSPPT